MPTPNQLPSPPAPDQPEREDRAEHATGADGRVEDADAGVARVQEVDRDHDGEHGQAAARERLHQPEPRDQRRAARSAAIVAKPWSISRPPPGAASARGGAS